MQCSSRFAWVIELFECFNVLVRVRDEVPLWLHSYSGVCLRHPVWWAESVQHVVYLLRVVEFVKTDCNLCYYAILRVARTLLRHGLASVGGEGFGLLKSSLGVSALGQRSIFEAAVILYELCLQRNVLLQAVIWIIQRYVLAYCVYAKLGGLRLNQIRELDPLVSRVKFIWSGLGLVTHEVTGCVALVYHDVLRTFSEYSRLAMPRTGCLSIILMHRIVEKARCVDDHPS